MHKTSMFGCALALSTAVGALAQSLPAPSRTVYKCVVQGKTVYTDDPCVGAQRVDVEPTRGLNQASGRELTGRDVAREKQTEQMAQAVKPLTGLTPQQFEVRRKRHSLSPPAQAECARLDGDIARSEGLERSASTTARPVVQRDLYALRQRHRDLQC